MPHGEGLKPSEQATAVRRVLPCFSMTPPPVATYIHLHPPTRHILLLLMLLFHLSILPFGLQLATLLMCPICNGKPLKLNTLSTQTLATVPSPPQPSLPADTERRLQQQQLCAEMYALVLPFSAGTHSSLLSQCVAAHCVSLCVFVRVYVKLFKVACLASNRGRGRGSTDGSRSCSCS